jgi:hypothetical protein
MLVYVARCRAAHTHLSQKHLEHRRLLTTRWISYVNEYGPELHYVEGSTNLIAVTFSWLSWKDTLASPAVGKKQPTEHSID